MTTPIEDLCETVYYQLRTGKDPDDGEPIWGPQKKTAGFHVKRVRVFSRVDGAEAVSTTDILTEISFTKFDRLWVPGEDHTDEKLSRLPIGIASVTDPEDGTFLQRTSL